MARPVTPVRDPLGEFPKSFRGGLGQRGEREKGVAIGSSREDEPTKWRKAVQAGGLGKGVDKGSEIGFPGVAGAEEDGERFDRYGALNDWTKVLGRNLEQGGAS